MGTKNVVGLSESHLARRGLRVAPAVLAALAVVSGCGEPTVPPATDVGPVDGGGGALDSSGDADTAPCNGPPGLYVAGSCTDLAPGVRSFAPQYVLWSDGAEKERFVYLPPGTTIDTSDPDAWVFPVGTILFKTFSRDGLRIETRINTKEMAGSGIDSWSMRTFAWSADQLSVMEVTDGVVNALGTGHDIPATSLCAQCHTGGAADVGLGFSAIQLNHAVGNALPLSTLLSEGLLSDPIDLTAAVIPGNAVTSAALGYLHANCGSCHGGSRPPPGGDPMNLWIDVGLTDPAATGTYMATVGHVSGWGGAPFRVLPGAPDQSAIFLRMSSRAPGTSMPPIATELTDATGIETIRTWIGSLGATCGDDMIDAGEDCDGTALNGETCASRGFASGTLGCSGCTFDESGCAMVGCGNGARGGMEECDGVDLGGATCATLGFVSGTPGCTVGCAYDTTLCSRCGNAAIDGLEACDGVNLAGQMCASRGFTGGTLACTATCLFDEAGCTTAMCGNGVIDSGETCDDSNVASGDGCAGCASESGWTCSGAPSLCNPTCGDGLIVGGENCDGANVGGTTCASFGFTGGTLGCTGVCSFSTLACTATSCGNGVINAGEECDDANLVEFDGCTPGCQVDAMFDLPVRLRNGEGSNHGMLEVYYGFTWRDVCDDVPNAAAGQALANVVCRTLGYTGAGHQFIANFVGGSGSPVMDDVACTGTEATLAQCPFAGWGVENCDGTEAVGIRCSAGEGDIRLVDGSSGTIGRLQSYHLGAWGEVCDDVLDSAPAYAAATVCQSLGYQGGFYLDYFNAPTDTFLLDNVSCVGTERYFSSCGHNAFGDENCVANEAAGFACIVAGEGNVRLAAAFGRNAGRVEILHNGVWGTVCDDGLEFPGSAATGFAAVTCGQLGYTRSGSVISSTSTVDGVNPTWLDQMACVGGEASLTGCAHNPFGTHDCSHAEDVGLTCTP